MMQLIVKRPGAPLVIESFDDEDAADAASRAYIGGGQRDGATIRTERVNGALVYIRMDVDDNGMTKGLPANFAYPNHPEMDVAGVAVFSKWRDVDDRSEGLAFDVDDAAWLTGLTAYKKPIGFRAPFRLAGWERQSVFGYDPPLETWFAQLTPNDVDENEDGPQIWLGGKPQEYGSIVALCAAIARALPAASPADCVGLVLLEYDTFAKANGLLST